MDGFREAVKMMHSLMHLRCAFSAGSRFLRLEILPKSLISNWSQWSGLNRRPTVYETTFGFRVRSQEFATRCNKTVCCAAHFSSKPRNAKRSARFVLEFVRKLDRFRPRLLPQRLFPRGVAVPETASASEIRTGRNALKIRALFATTGHGGIRSPPRAASITVPLGFVAGLQVGLSFFGRARSEPVLLKLAFAFAQATKVRRPPQFLSAVVPHA